VGTFLKERYYMGVSIEIEEILTVALCPQQLQIVNESDLHAGHSGDDGSGESHFKIFVVSEKFSSLSRIERYRLVHDLLQNGLSKRLHALSITARSPDEAA